MEYIEGLILKKLDYKESSKIIYIYTKKGLISVLIHGNRKANSPYLNLSSIMNYVKVYVSGKNLLVLRDGDVLKRYSEIKKDIVKFTYIQHILELVYNFANHDHNHEKLLNFLLKIFDKCIDTKNYIPYLNMIELKLLYLLGINPYFKHCVSCNRTRNLRFSIKEGGMCCEEHFPKDEVVYSNKCINTMKELYYFDLDKQKNITVDKLVLIELRKLIDSFYEYHLNFKSKSRRMLMELIGY